jgi:hypothetical protein
VPVVFNGGPVEANLTFSPITCQVSPAGPTCSVSPSSLTLDVNGNGTIHVTISTVGPATSMVLPAYGSLSTNYSVSVFLLFGFGLFCLAIGLHGRASQTRLGYLTLCAIAVCTTLWLSACTSGQKSNIQCANCTQAATYTVTINTSSVKPAFPASGAFKVVVAQ